MSAQPLDPSFADIAADLPGVRISEVILQTARYAELRLWYMGVLGLKPFYEFTPEATAEAAGAGADKQAYASRVRFCFLRLSAEFPYTQVLGIFEIPGLRDAPSGDPGLNHLQLRHASLDAVITRYERLREAGVRPHRSANHGPGSSFYYRDPDGNVVELSGPNFATETEYLAYFKSEAYRRNPSGIDVDPEAYVGRYRAGVPQAELVLIPA